MRSRFVSVTLWSAVVVGAAASVVFAASRPGQVVATVRETISPVTKEQLLEKVPNFYCFNYGGTPQPGKRYWLRVTNSLWIERYPDGFESKFKALGRAKVRDMEGTIVVKVAGDKAKSETGNKGGLLAFIPDKGSRLMHHLYKNTERGDEDWQDLGPMLSVE